MNYVEITLKTKYIGLHFTRDLETNLTYHLNHYFIRAVRKPKMNHCQSYQTRTSEPEEFFTAAKSTWFSQVFIDSQNGVTNTTCSFTIINALPSVAEAILKLVRGRASCVHQKVTTALSGGKNGSRTKKTKFRNESRRNTCTPNASRIKCGSTFGFTLHHHLMGKLQESQHFINSKECLRMITKTRFMN